MGRSPTLSDENGLEWGAGSKIELLGRSESIRVMAGHPPAMNLIRRTCKNPEMAP